MTDTHLFVDFFCNHKFQVELFYFFFPFQGTSWKNNIARFKHIFSLSKMHIMRIYSNLSCHENVLIEL